MKKATITEAKNQLSALIDQVRHGETIVITDRGAVRWPASSRRSPAPTTILMAVLPDSSGGADCVAPWRHRRRP
jgi:hypothetical protein